MPVPHLLLLEASELKTCETAALPPTSASPRRDSLYDAARRDAVSSVFTSGRRGGGSIARRSRFLPLPPSRRLSSGSNLVVPNHKSIGGAAASTAAAAAASARQTQRGEMCPL